MRYLIGFVCVAVLVVSPVRLLAQPSDSHVVSPRTLEVVEQSEVQRRLAELEAAYQKANVRKPRTGVAVSVIAITGGVTMLMAGLILKQGIFSEPPERDQRVGSGVMAAGSITVAAGIGGLAFSGVRLKRAKRQRRSLEPEIERLRSTVDWDAE